MSALISWLLLALLGLILLPVSVLAVQVLLAGRTSRSAPDLPTRPRLAVLMPAHNEALLIARTVAGVLPQLQSGDRLLVVADNCSDDTAALARQAGAEVVERCDPQLRGKGYALAFGREHLQADAPDIVVILDADCELGEQALQRLAAACVATARPVQALYLMRAPQQAGLKVRIAEFAWRVKNLLRPSGWAVLGLPCQLMGSGMAFAWRDLGAINLASGHLVEDLQMGLDLCRQGRPPLFCPAAQVISYFPSSDEGLSSQRTRWEHGHLGVILNEVPRLLSESFRRSDWRLLGMTLDLLVPPLALLTLLVLLVLVVAWGWLVVSTEAEPALLATLLAVLLGTTVLLAWWRCGRDLLSLTTLLYAPVYALKKLPLYLGFALKRQVEWVRSRRDEP